MIDYYDTLIVGITLFIGLIPLMSKKLRGDSFLVSYVDARKEESEVEE